ncbi:RDD family protein [Spongisporangium articulatum]|uniref:RDD family protein n=1 Tax=Spongisporangium articulatum TaxID=3362603 RepID=A0ABW8AT07_9ACTN
MTESETGLSGYVPGADLGRPAEGPGSVARPGRRLLSLVIDWAVCLLIARGLFQASPSDPAGSLVPVLVLVVENALLIPTAGATLGQRLAGVQTERVDGGRLGLGVGLVRAVLLALVVPPFTLIWQRDLRGAHDLAAGAVVVRN